MKLASVKKKSKFYQNAKVHLNGITLSCHPQLILLKILKPKTNYEM
ncbi:hypothetical protein P689_119137 [Candidatus Riesia pediculischaeffi PTSU]|uniref:Uncharacterized protein n=1 Tax=Candidatus Riesia pediculischaeffi PTSU TaxID=1401651 RepID=A0A0C1SA57_9ENTR|nr:hypothetical protein P689_119137 [Candidatus Riesia pediculischaeffi PTSU]